MEGRMMSSLSAIITVVVTILLSAFFSGSETAAVSCSKIRLRHRANEGSWRARLLESLLGSPERFFSIVLVGTNISVIICTAAATALAVSVFGNSGAAAATIVITPLLLIFGEVIPKSAFLYHADRISITVAPLLKLFSFVLWPLVVPATLFARILLRITGSHEKRFNLLSNREELIYLYRRGKKEDSMERRERLIIDRVFHFGRVRAGDLMVPMDRVVSFAATASVEEVIGEANEHSFSRFPITSPRGERVVGIISLFDLLGLDGGERLTSVMHHPFFVNESESAEKLLVMMKEEALHMAVIVGDRQEVRGIVTLEDILESIVGDIANEYE